MLFLMLMAVLLLATAGSVLAVRRNRRRARTVYRRPPSPVGSQPRPDSIRAVMQKRETEELIAAVESYLRAQITTPRREE